MKNFFFFLLVFLPCTSLFSKSGDGTIAYSREYRIESDVFTQDVPVGKCRVTGQVMGPMIDTMSPQPIAGGLIASLDGEHRTNTDANGMYTLLLDAGDTTVYFYSPGYSEVVVWNYDFKSRHTVTINFFPHSTNNWIMVDKPVIYMYSEEETDVNITFSCIGELSFTYPEYHESWNVSVNDNGLTDLNSGKNYPYLFWESKTSNLAFNGKHQTLHGFHINTDTALAFLEHSLAALGFSPTEQTDFITFWAPRMMQHEEVIVQFLIDDEYEQTISQMTISPQPDAMRRVYMLFAPVDKIANHCVVVPQQLPIFERNGFTVVEWGGSEIKFNGIIP